MKCPVCRATYRPNETSCCQRCKTDLSPLIQIHDRAVWQYRQALQSFATGDYLTAQAHNDRAIALHSNNADFHAFAGQLRALQGDFQQAIVAWKQAQQLEPLHPIAGTCLQILSDLSPLLKGSHLRAGVSPVEQSGVG